MSTPSSSSAAVALRLLRAAGLAGKSGKCILRTLAFNPERRDQTTRRLFMVLIDEEPAAVATIGPDLSALRSRTELFHRAYPGLACKVLGSGTSDDGEVLLTEYFAGKQLNAGDLNDAEMCEVLGRIESAFTAAVSTSTIAAAQAELYLLFKAVLALGYWTRADRAFLENVVFTLTEQQLIAPAPCKRISNGDLIPQNILVDSSGAIRIVDCEFAKETHFFAEDWLRFTYWSSLPGPVREFALAKVDQPIATRLYLALKQLVTEHAVNLPQKAHSEAETWCIEIRRLVESQTPELRQSMLWPVDAESSDAGLALSVELFWLTDEGWSKERSLRAAASFNRTCTLRFNVPAGPTCHGFRLDPGEAPAAVTLHSVKIETVAAGSSVRVVAFSTSEPGAFENLKVGGDAIICSPAGSDQLDLVSIGNDPQVYITGVGAPMDHRVEVEIRATFQSNPAHQLRGLRAFLQSHAKAAEAARRDLAASQARLDEADRIRTEAFASTRAYAERLGGLQSQVLEAVEAADRNSTGHLGAVRTGIQSNGAQIKAATEQVEALRASVIEQGARLLQELSGGAARLKALSESVAAGQASFERVQLKATEELVSTLGAVIREAMASAEKASAADFESVRTGVASLGETLLARLDADAEALRASTSRIAGALEAQQAALQEIGASADARTQAQQAQWAELSARLRTEFDALTSLVGDLRKLSQAEITGLDEIRRESASQTSAISKLTSEVAAHREAREQVALELQTTTGRYRVALAQADASEAKSKEFAGFLAGHARTIDRLEQAVANEAARAAKSEDQVRALIESGEANRASLRHAEDQLGRLAQEIAGLRERLLAREAELEAAANRQTALEHTLDNRNAELTRLTGDLATLHTRLKAEHLATAALKTDLAAEHAARSRIEATRSWRWTAPFRRIFAWIPADNS